MGVRGLTSFIDEHPKFLSDLSLHDTKVLIDGNNLYYFLYYNYFSINLLYGGDYDCYANTVRYFFNTLNTCNIVPYVIFDGGYDVDERKLKTTLKRQKERLQNVNALSKGQKGIVLPLLAFDVFRLVLDDLGVSHMTCDFEADDHLAGLAQLWNLPVMSNDSDFFIFDLPAGFIIFDYIDLDVKRREAEDGTSYKSINVQLFLLDNFVKHYKGLQKELVPIFATLLGNDFVETDQFECFFARAKLPKVSYSPRISHRRSRMMSLLMWLESQESVESAIETIAAFMPVSQQEKSKRLLYTSVQTYTSFSSPLLDYFDVKDTDLKLKSQLKTYGGNLVPHWITREFRKAHMPLNAVNALTLHRNLLLQQVELLTERSSYRSARKIRQIMYSVLLTLDEKLNERPAAKKDQRPREKYIEEYDREGKDIRCDRVAKVTELPDGSAIPYLQEIPHMPPSERWRMFLLCVGVEGEVFKDVPECLHFIIAVLYYWVKNSTPKVPVHLLYAMVGCIIKLMFLSEDGVDEESDKLSRDTVKEKVAMDTNLTGNAPHPIPENAKDEEDSDTGNSLNSLENFKENLCMSCTEQQKDFAKKNLARFTVASTHSTSNKFQTIITHNCAQFQACFQALQHLNMLFLEPVSCPSPACVYSGTFLYNMCVVLQRRSQPKLYLPELFGVRSPLSKFYFQIVHLIEGIIADDDFADTSFSKAKKKNKTKKSKGKGVKKQDKLEKEDEDDGNQRESLSVNCSLTNRFLGLSLATE